MDNLATDVTNIINEYIAKGMTTEQVCGVLDVVSFRVKQNSYTAEPTKAESGGGGSPVSLGHQDIMKETSPEQKEEN